MRRTRRPLPLVTLAVALFAGRWLACGGDYQSDGPLTGDTGGKCFPDGSCKAGLICLSNLCVVPPDSGSTSSGGTSDGGGEIDSGNGGDSSTTDSGLPTCPMDETAGLAPGVACESPRKCNPGQVCCPRQTSTWECVEAAEQCAAPAMRIECDSPADCPPAQQCCFGVALAPARCTDGTLVSGICAPTCPGATLAVCEPGHPCSVGKCTDRTVVLQRSMRVVHRGLCEPQ